MLAHLLLIVCMVVAAPAAEISIATLVGTDLDRRFSERQAAVLKAEMAKYVDSWQAHGEHGSWDAQALEALTIYARQSTEYTKSPNYRRLYALLGQLLAGGCNDPLIRYVYLRSGQVKVTAADLIALAEPMGKAGYPPGIRFSLARRTINAVVKEGGPADPRLDGLWKSLPALVTPLLAAGSDPISAYEILDFAELVWYLPGKTDMSLITRQREAIQEACAQESVPEWWRQYLSGVWNCIAAQAVHSGDVVASESYRSHLRAARACLTRAWQLDPSNGRAAARMALVCALDEPKELRLWFDRAISADPFLEDPYAVLQNFSSNMDDLLTLATECVACKAWSTPIPRQAWRYISAARRLSKEGPSKVWADPRTWACFDAITAGERGLPGSDVRDRDGQRLAYAWVCGQRQEAVRLWKSLGDTSPANSTLSLLRGKRADMNEDLRTWSTEDVQPQKDADF